MLALSVRGFWKFLSKTNTSGWFTALGDTLSGSWLLRPGTTGTLKFEYVMPTEPFVLRLDARLSPGIRA